MGPRTESSRSLSSQIRPAIPVFSRWRLPYAAVGSPNHIRGDRTVVTERASSAWCASNQWLAHPWWQVELLRRHGATVLLPPVLSVRSSFRGARCRAGGVGLAASFPQGRLICPKYSLESLKCPALPWRGVIVGNEYCYCRLTLGVSVSLSGHLYSVFAADEACCGQCIEEFRPSMHGNSCGRERDSWPAASACRRMRRGVSSCSRTHGNNFIRSHDSKRRVCRRCND